MSLSQQAASVASSSSSEPVDGRVPATTAAPRLSHQQSASHRDRRAKLEQWKADKEMLERTAEKRRVSASASSRPLGLGKENHARVCSAAATAGLAGTSATPAASAATIAATTSRLSTPRVRPTSEAPGRRVGTTPSSLARRTQSLGKVGGVFSWVSLLPIPASLVLGLHSRFGDEQLVIRVKYVASVQCTTKKGLGMCAKTIPHYFQVLRPPAPKTWKTQTVLFFSPIATQHIKCPVSVLILDEREMYPSPPALLATNCEDRDDIVGTPHSKSHFVVQSIFGGLINFSDDRRPTTHFVRMHAAVFEVCFFRQFLYIIFLMFKLCFHLPSRVHQQASKRKLSVKVSLSSALN